MKGKQKYPSILITLTLILVILVGITLYYSNQKEIIKRPLVGEIDSCFLDSDCTIVQQTCCGCHAGGRSIPINKKYLSYWEENLGDCTEVLCTQVISDDWTCKLTVKARCESRKCELYLPE